MGQGLLAKGQLALRDEQVERAVMIADPLADTGAERAMTSGLIPAPWMRTSATSAGNRSRGGGAGEKPAIRTMALSPPASGAVAWAVRSVPCGRWSVWPGWAV